VAKLLTSSKIEEFERGVRIISRNNTLLALAEVHVHAVIASLLASPVLSQAT
jgi:hypothetical protein